MNNVVNRRLRSGAARLALGVTLVLQGCSIEAGAEEGGTGLDSDGEPMLVRNNDVQKITTTPPSTFVGTIEIGAGSWGNWSLFHIYCDLGSYAYAVNVRSEAPQGSGDDTALNDVALECFNKTTGQRTGVALSAGGSFGTTMPWATTNPFAVWNPFVGGRMKIEAPQGSGDDTSANQVSLQAMNGFETVVDSLTAWGTWNAGQPGEALPSHKKCPAGSAVCGINTRYETHRGNGFDDTALNGIRLHCCTF